MSHTSRMIFPVLALLYLTSCGESGSPVQVRQNTKRDARSPQAATTNPPPNLALDRAEFFVTEYEPQPLPRLQPGDPQHFITNKRLVLVRRPEGGAAERDVRLAVWWTDNDGFHWNRAGTFERGQRHFLLRVPRDGDYGVRFVAENSELNPSLTGRIERMYHVDTRPPDVTVNIRPDVQWFVPGDELIVDWAAEDFHLTETPVRIGALLDFSADRQECVELLGRLAAEGEAALPVPGEFVGHEFTIRVEALDRAGNLGVAYSHALRIAGESPVERTAFQSPDAGQPAARDLVFDAAADPHEEPAEPVRSARSRDVVPSGGDRRADSETDDAPVEEGQHVVQADAPAEVSAPLASRPRGRSNEHQAMKSGVSEALTTLNDRAELAVETLESLAVDVAGRLADLAAAARTPDADDTDSIPNDVRLANVSSSSPVGRAVPAPVSSATVDDPDCADEAGSADPFGQLVMDIPPDEFESLSAGGLPERVASATEFDIPAVVPFATAVARVPDADTNLVWQGGGPASFPHGGSPAEGGSLARSAAQSLPSLKDPASTESNNRVAASHSEHVAADRSISPAPALAAKSKAAPVETAGLTSPPLAEGKTDTAATQETGERVVRRAVGVPSMASRDERTRVFFHSLMGGPERRADATSEAAPNKDVDAGASGIRPVATIDPTRGSGLMVPMPATVSGAGMLDSVATAHPWRVLGDVDPQPREGDAGLTLRARAEIDGALMSMDTVVDDASAGASRAQADVWLLPEATRGQRLRPAYEARFLADVPELRTVAEPAAASSAVAGVASDAPSP